MQVVYIATRRAGKLGCLVQDYAVMHLLFCDLTTYLRKLCRAYNVRCKIEKLIQPLPLNQNRDFS